ncbi:unnamed protein product, partial [Ectocarpus sp. 8 AP-2014]
VHSLACAAFRRSRIFEVQVMRLWSCSFWILMRSFLVCAPSLCCIQLQVGTPSLLSGLFASAQPASTPRQVCASRMPSKRLPSIQNMNHNAIVLRIKSADTWLPPLCVIRLTWHRRCFCLCTEVS